MIFSLLIIFLAVIICRVKCLSVQLCFVLFSWAIVLPPPATTTKLDHYEHKQLHSFMKTAKRAAKEKLVNPTPQVSVTATVVVLTVISVLLVGTLCVSVALRRSRRGHDIEAAGQPTLSQSVYIQIAICRL